MNEIAAAQRRAKGYWFVDGVAEIAGGTSLLVCGALLYAAVATGIESLGMAALVVLVAGFPLSAWIVRKVKEHITYPRTGYVAYPPPSRLRRFLAAAIGFVIASLLVPVMAVVRGDEISAVVLAAGLLIGAVLAVRAWRIGVPRFYFMAASTVVFSAILSTSETLGVQDSIGILMAFEGGVLVANGMWTLLGYLKAHRAPEGGAA